MPARSVPDVDRLRHRLTGPDRLWSGVEVVETVDSTNQELARRIRAGAGAEDLPAPGAGVILMADHQSSGRGRFDRRWQAPPGTAVATSVAVVPRRPMAEWSWLSLLTGVAIARGVSQATGLQPTLKWPNDVLIADRKICGILSERVEAAHGPACVVGFGINVYMSEADLPVPTATSLLLEGALVDKTSLMVAVLTQWEKMYAAWDAGGVEDLRATYERACDTVGRHVRVQLEPAHGREGPGPRARDVVGQAVGVDSTGALEVEVEGQVHAYAAGDVTHLRRAH